MNQENKSMPVWKYGRKHINNIEDVYNIDPSADGFIYLVEFTNGMKYVGKKSLFHFTKIKGKRAKKKVSSRWEKYYGSIKDEDFKKEFGNTIYIKKRTILCFCTKKLLTYSETKHLFLHNVLEDPKYYNRNILGRFYSGALFS